MRDMDNITILRTEEVEMTHLVMSSRFGEISYSEDDVLVFPRGLPAFEENRNWVLAGEEENAIKWLQNVEDGELALPVTTPDAVMADYNAKIPEDDLNMVGTKDFTDLALLIVVSIPESAPWNMTANLRAPILVNLESRKAVQVIVLNEEYPVRHTVFPENVREKMKSEALEEV